MNTGRKGGGDHSGLLRVAAVVAHELASVAESLFSVWAASPQGQVAAMMMQAAHEREQNEGQALGQEASDAAG